MKTYQVVNSCTWKSKGDKRARFWPKDQIVTLDDSEKPPHHFKLIGNNARPQGGKPGTSDQKPLSAMGIRPVPAGGMAAGMDNLVPATMRTRGQVAQSKK